MESSVEFESQYFRLATASFKFVIHSNLFFSYLLPEKGKGVKQKTSVCRKTTSPRWEAALSWDDLTPNELSERSLELTVWDHDRIGHNEMLGGVRFNLGTGES